jgi:hypothetical protein
MDFNKLFQSKSFKVGLIALGTFIVLFLVFKAGVFVGYKKAQFSYRWGENYHRNFAGPRGGFFGDFGRGFGDRGDFINAHGTFGSVIKIDGTTVIVKGRDDIEKTILVPDDAAIRRGRESIKVSALKVDDKIVVIGSPNEQGQIEAKLIRVFSEEMIKGLPYKRSRPPPFF